MRRLVIVVVVVVSWFVSALSLDANAGSGHAAVDTTITASSRYSMRKAG
ncbi:hypothetical protein AWB81_06149 [Caballeronia arationis]|jgi:hypothetical protein|uniref:Uncharacterized protein n=1 Tax=Caballeronia arationis TaxID=1777142 RepID=A0A7Z7I2H1_9BURK|nr:hypothetical protein AWB81_06149 [Caballeronia arationis]SOE55643.1 hypothetical protein SAMN05446927_1062 [Caballeronia arationis]